MPTKMALLMVPVFLMLALVGLVAPSPGHPVRRHRSKRLGQQAFALAQDFGWGHAEGRTEEGPVADFLEVFQVCHSCQLLF